MSVQTPDHTLLASIRKSPVDYQRLQDTVKGMHPLFEGFVSRAQEGVQDTVLAPYLRLPEDARLDAETISSLAVALQEFAHRFRPDLLRAPERWAVAEVAVSFYPRYLLWYPVAEDPETVPVTLEHRDDAGVAAKGLLRDVLANLP